MLSRNNSTDRLRDGDAENAAAAFNEAAANLQAIERELSAAEERNLATALEQGRSFGATLAPQSA